MAYVGSKLITLDQLKSALQTVKTKINSIDVNDAKSHVNTKMITYSGWTIYDDMWKWSNVQTASNGYYYDVHLSVNTSNEISMMCANCDIRAKIESGKIVLYAAAAKPTQNFDLEIVEIPTTDLESVAITYDIGDDYLVYPAKLAEVQDQVDGVETNLQTLSDAVDNKVLISQNVSLAITKWSVSGDTDYPWRAEIIMPGVTSAHYPMVQFRDSDCLLYDFSPIASTSENKVTIFCKTTPTSAIVIPTIICTIGTVVEAS